MAGEMSLRFSAAHVHGRLHLSWQVPYFVDLNARVVETCNSLLTLCLSHRSRCGAVGILILFAQPSRTSGVG